MPRAPVYCIDTSSILEWYVRRYPPELLPSLPAKMEELIGEGRLRAPRAVMDEIKVGDDCHKWAKAQTELFVEEAVAVQAIVRRLMQTHHDPAKPTKGINGADPFVIAMAKHGGAGWVVVSDEHPGSAENRKIPFVCGQENIECIDFHEMMRRERWQFR